MSSMIGRGILIGSSTGMTHMRANVAAIEHPATAPFTEWSGPVEIDAMVMKRALRYAAIHTRYICSGNSRSAARSSNRSSRMPS
eukprot:1024489-Pyramimonas_sp.AAC.1